MGIHHKAGTCMSVWLCIQHIHRGDIGLHRHRWRPLLPATGRHTDRRWRGTGALIAHTSSVPATGGRVRQGHRAHIESGHKIGGVPVHTAGDWTKVRPEHTHVLQWVGEHTQHGLHCWQSTGMSHQGKNSNDADKGNRAPQTLDW